MESVMGEKGRRELKVCEEGGSESVTEKYIFFNAKGNPQNKKKGECFGDN